MKVPFYQVDAFADSVFAGNPAAVCLLDEWLGTEVLQRVAEENNLSRVESMGRLMKLCMDGFRGQIDPDFSPSRKKIEEN